MKKVTNPNIKVYTGEDWLFNMFNGLKSRKGNAVINVITDPNGRKIISKSINNDPTWNLDIEITHPITGLKTTPRQEIWEIDYCYWEEDL